MLRFCLLTGIALLSLCVRGQSQQSLTGWNGIVPLRSTRSDVERIVGQSSGACKCIYDHGKDRIIVEYSDELCHPGGPDESKIPKDTVTYVTVYPAIKPKVSDLNLDGPEYTKSEERE
jgi:hypothetical protein